MKKILAMMAFIGLTGCVVTPAPVAYYPPFEGYVWDPYVHVWYEVDVHGHRHYHEHGWEPHGHEHHH